MYPVQRLLCTLTPVQYVASFSAGEVGHLSLVSVAYEIVYDSTQCTPFLTHWLRDSLESFLSLIISFLVQLQHLLFLSLDKSHFFSGQSRHTSSSLTMLYLSLGAERLTTAINGLHY
jgi:hypothetical protein